jgi:cytidylate kinase
MDEISKKEKWIIDSRGDDWSIEGIKKADLIIWLQTNLFIRCFRIIKRYIERKKKNLYKDDFKSMF